MADERVTTTPLPTPPGEKLDYQPISMWAVCGLILGILIAGLVVGSGALVLFSGNPLFLPGETLALAIAGAVASFIARRQILSSEGTRTGLSLARWGMWLSVLSGVGYVTFKEFTGLAVQIQANDFMMTESPEDEGKRVPDSGFFPRLLESVHDDTQYNCAFLLTVDDRAGASPQDEKAMLGRFNVAGKKSAPRLKTFRENDMVVFVRQSVVFAGGKDKIKIEPVGVESWDYKRPDGGRGYYEIVRTYRITTPEIIREYHLVVQSLEPAGPGDKRQWFLNLLMSGPGAKSVTPLGVELGNLRYSVHVALSKWLSDPKNSLKSIDKKTDFYKKHIPDEKLRRYIQENLAANLKLVQMFETTPWREVDRRLEISYPVRAMIDGGKAFPENYRIDGYITVQSESPLDPNEAGHSETASWTNFSLKLLDFTPVAKLPAPLDQSRDPADAP